MLTLKDVAKITQPGEPPLYTQHGYVVAEDGTTYSLYHPFTHGLVLAMLYPDLLSKFRSTRYDSYMYYASDDVDGDNPERSHELRIPHTRADLIVSHFQDFELTVHGELPVIRVCPGRMMGHPSIDLNPKGCTPAQRTAVQAIIKVMGWSARTIVSTDHCDIRIKDLADVMAGADKLKYQVSDDGDTDGEDDES